MSDWLEDFIAGKEGAELLADDRPRSLLLPLPALIGSMQALKAQGFDMLNDHMAVDNPEGEHIRLLWLLCSTESGELLRVCCDLPRQQPVAPSLNALWPVAEWQEREVYDLFGVLYSGHPDLRRLFLEDDWEGWPLRKDYEDSFILEPGKP